jgi:hypothetical protein
VSEQWPKAREAVAALPLAPAMGDRAQREVVRKFRSSQETPSSGLSDLRTDLLPMGGGVIRGIDHKFTVNPAIQFRASRAVPSELMLCRNGALTALKMTLRGTAC